MVKKKKGNNLHNSPNTKTVADVRAAGKAFDAVVIQAQQAFNDEKIVSTEGIFRVTGSVEDKRRFYSQAIEEVNANKPITNVFSEVNNVHTSVSVLKDLWTSLHAGVPESLTNQMHEIIAIKDSTIKQQHMQQFWAEFKALDPDSYQRIQLMLEICRQVQTHSATNKMHAQNLATVLGPGLYRMLHENQFSNASTDDMIRQTQYLKQYNALFVDLIAHPDWMQVDESLAAKSAVAIELPVGQQTVAETRGPESEQPHVAEGVKSKVDERISFWEQQLKAKGSDTKLDRIPSTSPTKPSKEMQAKVGVLEEAGVGTKLPESTTSVKAGFWQNLMSKVNAFVTKFIAKAKNELSKKQTDENQQQASGLDFSKVKKIQSAETELNSSGNQMTAGYNERDPEQVKHGANVTNELKSVLQKREVKAGGPPNRPPPKPPTKPS